MISLMTLNRLYCGTRGLYTLRTYSHLLHLRQSSVEIAASSCWMMRSLSIYSCCMLRYDKYLRFSCLHLEWCYQTFRYETIKIILHRCYQTFRYENFKIIFYRCYQTFRYETKSNWSSQTVVCVKVWCGGTKSTNIAGYCKTWYKGSLFSDCIL